MGEWISVNDLMPNEGQEIIAYGIVSGEIYGEDSERSVACGKFVKDSIALPCDCYSSHLIKISHWIPLPELPKD